MSMSGHTDGCDPGSGFIIRKESLVDLDLVLEHRAGWAISGVVVLPTNKIIRPVIRYSPDVSPSGSAVIFCLYEWFVCFQGF